MPSYERLDYGSPDGSQWGGASTEALGMYGVTPVVQYTAVGVASTYITQSTGNAVGTTWGFTSSAHLTSMILQVSTITAALRGIGLIS